MTEAEGDTATQKIAGLLNSTGLLDHLAGLTKPAAIVAERPLLDHIARRVRNGPALLDPDAAEDGIGSMPPGGPYIVISARDEIALKRRLRAALDRRGIRAEIYGALHDLWPMDFAPAPQLERRGMEAYWETLSRARGLTIVCTPRSGSQFLARELTSRGIGAPQEHIRPELIRLLDASGGARPGRLDFVSWFAATAHHATVNDVFGTKIISHFIQSLEKTLSASEWGVLMDYLSKSNIIYLLRTSKIMQALSRDRAKFTNHYHVFDDKNKSLYADKSQGWGYDYSRISEEIRRLDREERHLMKLIVSIRPDRDFTVVRYETMNSENVIADAATALGLANAPASRDLPTRILRDDLTLSYAERFAADYRRSFDKNVRPTHLVHSTDYDEASGKLVRRVDPEYLTIAT